MMWRRRNFTHITKLLSLLAVVVFVVHQVWQPRPTGAPWLRAHPVVTEGDGVLSRMLTGVNSTVKGDTHFTSFTMTPSNTSGENKEGVAEWTSSLTSPGPFPYIINEPDKCVKMKAAPFLVLLITTEARKMMARNAVRQTWGNESLIQGLGIIRLFLLGKSEGEQGLSQQKALESESQRHHDIIQQDFLDTYNNLTIKTLMGMNWVAMHCAQASYVMKTDNDMFVNTEYLISELLRPDVEPKKDYFTGYLMRKGSPIRNKNSKWYMSPEEYPDKRYPTFASGTGYVFSGDLASKIYHISLIVPIIHLEDVYVGMCLAKLQIEPTPPPNDSLFYTWRRAYTRCSYSRLITSHGFHPNDLLKYWQSLQSDKHKPCPPFSNKAVKVFPNKRNPPAAINKQVSS